MDRAAALHVDEQHARLGMIFAAIERQAQVVELRQADFSRGTYRARTPNVVLRLMEDVDFHPNPEHDFMPTDPSEHPSPPYQLGFFAAIAVEADDVIIDLNGHRLRQSAEHALKQRFFACIELGSQPFVANQGPATFGAATGCARVCIRNGFLGLSSHHGVHSPGGAREILIEDVQIAEFEVGGVHLNGAEDAQLRRVHVGPARQDVPVISTYSQARFVRRHLDAILARDPDASLAFASGAVSGAAIRDELRAALAAVEADVAAGRPVADPVFANADGLSDCNVYGVVLSSRGVAINGFMLEPKPDLGNRNVSLVDVTVFGLSSRVREVVGVNNPGAAVADGAGYGGGLYCTGPAGDVIRFTELTDDQGRYRPTALSQAQLFVAHHAATDAERGTAAVHPDLVRWALEGAASLDSVVQEPFYYVHGGDSMAHVQKGQVGLFLQNAALAHVVRACVSGVEQLGAPGGGAEQGLGRTDPLNRQHTLGGYAGATARGVAVVSCRDLVLCDLEVREIRSAHADAIGVDYVGVNVGVSSSGMRVDGLQASRALPPPPNPTNTACPLRMRDGAEACVFAKGCPAMMKDSK